MIPVNKIEVTSDSPLTLQRLKDLPDSSIFATGLTTNMRLYDGEVRWVAKRGGIHDWAIYYHLSSNSDEYVASHGDKMFTEAVIRELVPCDDEAYKMYRF